MKPDRIDPAELDAYDAWVAEHLDDMVRKHPGKVIAVYQGRLIAVGNTYREVFEATKAQGIAESPSRCGCQRPTRPTPCSPRCFPAATHEWRARRLPPLHW